MSMYRFRMSVVFFFQYHGRKVLLIGLAVIILAAAGFFGIRPAVNAITHRVAVHRFDNMSRETMIQDFEYLMTALEENWPFFNLSASANNVDVRVLADNTRALLNDPATDISCPLDFFDIILEHFFTPINQLGHLWPTPSYEGFFTALEYYRWSVEQGVDNRWTTYQHDLFHKPEVIMFYSRLRDAGRGSPPRVIGGTVMEFDFLEEGRTAYMRVNRMINVWDDTWSYTRGMWHYQYLMYVFNQDIEGYEHLIIDFRDNTGGRKLHFMNFVMHNFLHERIIFDAYVHFMGGGYANLAREIYDMRSIYPVWNQLHSDLHLQGIAHGYTMPEIHFAEPLQFMDPQINLAHTFETVFNINPVYHYYEYLSSSREEVLFDGKIWLLTDERTASAAEAVVAILKYNDIVTVVGEPTWGILGVEFEPTTIHISLPNTGILIRFDVAYYTDHYGRPLQGHGIQPHYINRPGMDALETVLAMIEEGSY